MTRRLLLLALALAVGVPGASAAPVCSDQLVGINERCPEWVASYNHTGRGGRGEDIGRDLALSPDGSTVYVTGQSRDDATADDQAVVAVDAATGATTWVGRYDATGSFDTGSSVAVAPDGARVFVAGRSIGADGSFDWATVAYDAATGARLWDARYATPGMDRTWGVAPSPDGETVFVAGESNGGDIATVAYDAATGEPRWEAIYDNGGHELAFDIGVAPDGTTVYAAGISGAPATGMDLVVVAFRAAAEEEDAAGSIRWVSRLDGGGRGAETFAGFDVDAGGDALAIAGFTNGDQQTLTAALDPATGAERWRVLAAGSPGDGDHRDSVAIGGGRVLRIARVTTSTESSWQFSTVAYDADDGAVAWSATQGSEPFIKDIAKSVTLSPDGARVFVSGYSVVPYGETNGLRIEPGKITTVAYDAATGARRWVAQHNQSGVGADFPNALAVSPDGGRVFVGGTFITSGVFIWPTDLSMAYAYDFGVVAYDA